MAYVRVPDPLLDVNKPGRSADWKQIRDNQDYFDAQIDLLIRKANVTDNDIRDHFFGSVQSLYYVDAVSTAGSDPNYGNWQTKKGGGDTATLISQHTLRMATNGNAAADYVVYWASPQKQRIVKSEEYIAYCEARVKRSGTDASHYVFGWNDDGLFGGGTEEAGISDQSDCVLVIRDASGNWQGITALGSAGSSTVGFGTGGSWSRIRMEFTCSATAGNRKVEFYLDDVLQATINTDANLPSVSLCPVFGTRGDTTGAASRQVDFDYIEFGWLSTPLAA